MTADLKTAQAKPSPPALGVIDPRAWLGETNLFKKVADENPSKIPELNRHEVRQRP